MKNSILASHQKKIQGISLFAQGILGLFFFLIILLCEFNKFAFSLMKGSDTHPFLLHSPHEEDKLWTDDAHNVIRKGH